MPDIKPFRDYSEHDVINLFAYEDVSAVRSKGIFVKAATNSGWNTAQDQTLSENAGFGFDGTLSPRWSNPAVVTAADSGDAVIGMTIKATRS